MESTGIGLFPAGACSVQHAERFFGPRVGERDMTVECGGDFPCFSALSNRLLSLVPRKYIGSNDSTVESDAPCPLGLAVMRRMGCSCTLLQGYFKVNTGAQMAYASLCEGFLLLCSILTCCRPIWRQTKSVSSSGFEAAQRSACCWGTKLRSWTLRGEKVMDHVLASTSGIFDRAILPRLLCTTATGPDDVY